MSRPIPGSGLRVQLAVVAALVRRALNEITRVPGAAIPGVIAPTIFVVGLSSVFGQADRLEGFGPVDFTTFVVPVGFLQAAGFTGAATGVNLARDIERGWFDRLLLCPAPRLTVLAGVVASAALRCLLPVTFLFVVAMLIGVDFPGVDGVVVALPLIAGLASALACFSVALALRFRTQQAAPLMQMGSFVGVLFTPAYAPPELLAGWLRRPRAGRRRDPDAAAAVALSSNIGAARARRAPRRPGSARRRPAAPATSQPSSRRRRSPAAPPPGSGTRG
mgnify:CR=1 FL=1